MKVFKLFAVLAVLLGLAMAVLAASVEDETETALAGLDIDDEATEMFNAQAFTVDEEEAVSDEGSEGVERRGAWKHSQKPMYYPPSPAACCYWKGYGYPSGAWVGSCYCDKSGQWVCVKPQPPAPKCCVWNGKYYYTGQTVWYSNCYVCVCGADGNWGSCKYYAPQPAPKPYYHRKKW